MQQKIASLKQALETAVDKHRDAYNQALGGLHVLDELSKEDSEGITEEELARSLGVQSLSFEPVDNEKQ